MAHMVAWTWNSITSKDTTACRSGVGVGGPGRRRSWRDPGEIQPPLAAVVSESKDQVGVEVGETLEKCCSGVGVGETLKRRCSGVGVDGPGRRRSRRDAGETLQRPWSRRIRLAATSELGNQVGIGGDAGGCIGGRCWRLRRRKRQRKMLEATSEEASEEDAGGCVNRHTRVASRSSPCKLFACCPLEVESIRSSSPGKLLFVLLMQFPCPLLFGWHFWVFSPLFMLGGSAGTLYMVAVVSFYCLFLFYLLGSSNVRFLSSTCWVHQMFVSCFPLVGFIKCVLILKNFGVFRVLEGIERAELR